jgi:hypothetical protein
VTIQINAFCKCHPKAVVALTGIEPVGRQSSSVQLGLSSCVFGLVQFATRALVAVRRADVLPWCCPAAGIRLIAGQARASGTASFHAGSVQSLTLYAAITAHNSLICRTGRESREHHRIDGHLPNSQLTLKITLSACFGSLQMILRPPKPNGSGARKPRDRDRKGQERVTALPKPMPPFGLREALSNMLFKHQQRDSETHSHLPLNLSADSNLTDSALREGGSGKIWRGRFQTIPGRSSANRARATTN